MLNNNGFSFHNDILRSYSGHPTYYVKEYRRTDDEKENGCPMTALEYLEDYREKQNS